MLNMLLAEDVMDGARTVQRKIILVIQLYAKIYVHLFVSIVRLVPNENFNLT